MKILYVILSVLLVTSCSYPNEVSSQEQADINDDPPQDPGPAPEVTSPDDPDDGEEMIASAPPFSEPSCLKPAIDLWVKVYTTYNTKQVIFLDDITFKIYKVIDVPGLDFMRERHIAVHKAMESFSHTLTTTQLAHLRTQSGISDKFAKSLAVAHKKIPEIQKKLYANKIPAELAFIPLIESGFETKARSRVGAQGPWQIMPRTLKLYSRANRNKLADLDFSTDIAIRILKDGYSILGSWPLSINAYNSGIGRLRKAVDQLHTKDMCIITSQYHDHAYKFVSRNYYAQFLAAKRIYFKGK